MPSSSPTWDVLFTVKSPASSTPDWYPTHWTRSPFQKLKFLQAHKQKADGILRAARVLSSEIPQHILIRETDNLGREAKIHYHDKGGFKGFRLQAVKRKGRWEATVWPGKEDLGWPEGKVARGVTLEECLGRLQGAIRVKWRVQGREGGDREEGKLYGSLG